MKRSHSGSRGVTQEATWGWPPIQTFFEAGHPNSYEGKIDITGQNNLYIGGYQENK